MQTTFPTYHSPALPHRPPLDSYDKLEYFFRKLRFVFNQPGLASFKHGFRNLHGLLTFKELRQMQALATSLPLHLMLEQQPRFVYKYLSDYTAASFSRTMRLTALLHHYRFLADHLQLSAFTALAGQTLLWQEQQGDDVLTISLSYPLFAYFEGELSLNFSLNSRVIQMVVFVVVPGHLIQSTSEQVLLIGQVQGVPNPELIRQATKLLHDITPAALLINAAYGLAAAWGLPHIAGVSMQEQLSVRTSASGCFDYDAFWQQFNGERTAANFYVLAVDAPEKAIEEVKSKYRARTLRKRQYKQAVRTTVEQNFRRTLLK